MKKMKLCRFLVIFLPLFWLGCGTPKTGAPAPVSLKVDYFSTASGLPGNEITCLAVFGGQIWVGTQKNGVCRYDGVNWQIHAKKNLPVLGSDQIEGMAVGANGIFIATDNGVVKYDGKSWNSVFTGSRARSVAVRGTEIAVATAHGVEHSTGGGFQVRSKENANLLNDEVKIVAFDNAGTLWVGMQLGMASLNGIMFQNFSGPAKTVMGSSLVEVPPSPANCQLCGNNINCIVPYKGMLAIGTTSGLCITNMKDNWTYYTAEHKDWFQRGGNIVEESVSGNSPIPGNSIGALLPAAKDSLLFVGTNKGLGLLEGTNWIDIQSKIPDLKSLRITALALANDNLWVGTSSGLYSVQRISDLLPALKNPQ